MNWIRPFQMESHGPVDWEATGRRLLRGAKAPVRPGARAANCCRTPVEIKSTRARAKAPNGPQSCAVRGVCSADYEGSLLAVKPSDTEGRAPSPSG
jgi:hypothetical protein